MNTLSRRVLLRTLGALPCLILASARAQKTQRSPAIGVLANHVPRAHLEMGAASPFQGSAAFVGALRDRGWEDGKSVRIIWRSGEGRFDRLPALASELVRRDVDVIVAGDNAVHAAMLATRSIPVVAYSILNPVEHGYAISLARPGKNLTGSLSAPSGGGHLQKALALLKELSPRIRRVALVAQSLEHADYHAEVKAGSPMDRAARELDMELFFVTFGDPPTLPEVVRSASRQGAHALLVEVNYAIQYHREIRDALAAEATQLRLPVLHLALAAAADGALMSTGISLEKSWQRAAYFVDRILRGQRPGDIPIESHPANRELHVNLKAARAIGLEVPPTLLLKADRVFE